MEPQEIDSALDELENRLDRLRSLYEQYFMGIEKIEPTVPRKDVDRRFWILRRTPIRNTARRFRLQTLTQRYNTFQQHWTRICREIENGTYVRHLLKAQKNLGADPKTWAAKKRLGLLRRDRPDSSAPAADASSPSATPPSARPSDHASRPSPSARPAAASEPPAARPVATAPNLSPLDLDLDDAPTLPPPPGGFRGAARPAAPAPAAVASRPSPIPLPGARARAASAIPRPAAMPSGTAASRAGLPSPPRPSPSRPPAAPAPPAMPARGPTTQVAARQPATPGSVGLAPRQVATPGAAAGPVVKQPAATASAATGLSDERVRQLHADLSSARQKLNQASSISVDSLAKSLRETEAKLRAQHGGSSVDFQVVIKDGKPIVKPVVRR